jgi:CRP/FNR family transcriptional regulator, cyclic AMP receptor protein
MNINDLLPQIPIFATLEPEEIPVVKEYLEKKMYGEGAPVFREGDPGDGLYIVALGAIKIMKRIDDKNEKVLAGFTDTDFFGELALLDGKPRAASAIATRSSVLLKLSVENFNKLMYQAPFAALKVVSQIAYHLSIRLRDTNIRLAELENYKILRG